MLDNDNIGAKAVSIIEQNIYIYHSYCDIYTFDHIVIAHERFMIAALDVE